MWPSGRQPRLFSSVLWYFYYRISPSSIRYGALVIHGNGVVVRRYCPRMHPHRLCRVWIPALHFLVDCRFVGIFYSTIKSGPVGHCNGDAGSFLGLYSSREPPEMYLQSAAGSGEIQQEVRGRFVRRPRIAMRLHYRSQRCQILPMEK